MPVHIPVVSAPCDLFGVQYLTLNDPTRPCNLNYLRTLQVTPLNAEGWAAFLRSQREPPAPPCGRVGSRSGRRLRGCAAWLALATASEACSPCQVRGAGPARLAVDGREGRRARVTHRQRTAFRRCLWLSRGPCVTWP